MVRKASTYVLCLNLYKLKIDTIIYQRVYPTIREFNDDDDDFIMCERIQFVYVETFVQTPGAFGAPHLMPHEVTPTSTGCLISVSPFGLTPSGTMPQIIGPPESPWQASFPPPFDPAQNMASLTKYCPFIVLLHCSSLMMSKSTSWSCSATLPDSVCPQPATQHFVPAGGCSPCGGRQAGAASGFTFNFIWGTLIMQMSFLICRLE